MKPPRSGPLQCTRFMPPRPFWKGLLVCLLFWFVTVNPTRAHLMSAGFAAITLQDHSALAMLAIPVEAIATLAKKTEGFHQHGLQNSDIQALRTQVLRELRQGLVLQADGRDGQIMLEDLIVSSQPDPKGHGISQVEWLIRVDWPNAEAPIKRLRLELAIFPPGSNPDFAYTVQLNQPAQAYSETALISRAQASHDFRTDAAAQPSVTFALGWALFWHRPALAILTLLVLATQASPQRMGIEALALLAGSCAVAWGLHLTGWQVPSSLSKAAAACTLALLCGAWFLRSRWVGKLRATAFYICLALLGYALSAAAIGGPAGGWLFLGHSAAAAVLVPPAWFLLRMNDYWRRVVAAMGFASAWFFLVALYLGATP